MNVYGILLFFFNGIMLIGGDRVSNDSVFNYSSYI